MAKVLFAPNKLVLKCSNCSTVLEAEVGEIVTRSGWIIQKKPTNPDDEYLCCPTCEEAFTPGDIQKTKVVLSEEDGKCPFCETPIGVKDKHCSGCGHVIERKKGVLIKR